MKQFITKDTDLQILQLSVKISATFIIYNNFVQFTVEIKVVKFFEYIP